MSDRITFCNLRDGSGWGIQGKLSPGELPPAVGTEVTVHKKTGDEVLVLMGEVLGGGRETDEYWIARQTKSVNRTPPPGLAEAEAAGLPVPPEVSSETETVRDEDSGSTSSIDDVVSDIPF